MSSKPSTTLGIDLAAQNGKTVACLIDWAAGKATVRAPIISQATDENVDWLADLVVPADAPAPGAVGIDAPFGWPVEMVHAVSAWSRGEKWPSPAKLDFRFRATDREVQAATGIWPLSVSSDLIAITTLRCVALLDAISSRRGSQDALSRTGGDDIFEVYPGAALTRWELTRRGYKTSGNAEKKAKQRQARIDLIAEIEHRTQTDDGSPWMDLSAAREDMIASDDALDAVIAAMIARAAAIGETIGPGDVAPALAERAEVEGWVHLPRKGSLDRLVAP